MEPQNRPAQGKSGHCERATGREAAPTPGFAFLEALVELWIPAYHRGNGADPARTESSVNWWSGKCFLDTRYFEGES